MKKILFVLFLIFLSCNSNKSIAETNVENGFPEGYKPNLYDKLHVEKTRVYEGIRVPITFTKPIDTRNHYVNDIIPIKVLNNVYINNKLIIKEGVVGSVSLKEATPSLWNDIGARGYIKITEGEVKDVFGNTVLLNLNRVLK